MKNESDKDRIIIGGSIFWVFIILVSLMGLSYLGIWAYQNDSVKGATISFIFFAMIITGIVLSKFEIFNIGTWSENCLSFTLGFGIWMAFGLFMGTQSVLSVSQNQYFSAISSELPQLLDFLTTIFVIPISEELFWMIAIPFSLFTIFNLLGKKYPIFSNNILQIFLISIVSGVTFAAFHVGKLIINFLLAAYIFRTIMIVLVYGDQKYDIIKKINLVVAFSLGAHIGNNLINYGFVKGNLILFDNFAAVGWMIYLLFLVIFISGFNKLLEIIFAKKLQPQKSEL